MKVALTVSLMFLSYLDVSHDLSLNRRTETRNILVLDNDVISTEVPQPFELGLCKRKRTEQKQRDDKEQQKITGFYKKVARETSI